MDFVEIKIALKDEAKKENKEFFLCELVSEYILYSQPYIDINDGILRAKERDLISNIESCCNIDINNIDVEATMSLYPDDDFVNINNGKIAQGRIFYLKDDLNENFEGFRKWTPNMAKGKVVTVKDVFEDGQSFNIEGGNHRTCYSIDMIDETKKLYSAAQIRLMLLNIYWNLESKYKYGQLAEEKDKQKTPNYREWDANRTKVTPPPTTNYTLPFISAILSFLIVMLIINISKL